MSKKLVSLFILFLSFLLVVKGQKSQYRTFDNIYPEVGASVVSFFVQDNQGVIWIGSNKGLFSYDGYVVQSHFSSGNATNTQIYCGVIVDTTLLYLGSDNGLLIYNVKTDKYEDVAVDFPSDIRTMALQGDTVWLGTLNGLYCYSISSENLKYFDVKTYKNMPHKTVYSIAVTKDRSVYVGTYDGFCRFLLESNEFSNIELPVNPQKNNQFINVLLEDTIRKCLWLGMEGNLLKYDLTSKVVSSIEGFKDNSVKSLALDVGANLLIGTDNGLYIYAENRTLQHVLHDSRNSNSLCNNIIWNIYKDRNRNIWLGTNYGISLSRNSRLLEYVPIYEISHTGDGNQFYNIYKDSRNNFWFGGSNGIIRVNKRNGEWVNPIWYNMDDKRNPLPHGRIRNIYEDRDNDLWIATDGSICKYDYVKEQFIPYNIVDSSAALNTNWAYNIFEDESGKLWIATCLGGIFVVDKANLLEHNGEPYVADYNYTKQNGLSGMFINQIVADKEGYVWVLLYNNGIDKITTKSKAVEKFPLQQYIGTAQPSYILCGKTGYVWVGYNKGVVRIKPENNCADVIPFQEITENSEVLSMIEISGKLWVSTTDGFWIVDEIRLKAQNSNLSERRFLSMYYDDIEEQIYLGDVDGFAVTSPQVIQKTVERRSIVATALFVNNDLYKSTEKSIRYLKQVDLNYRQNSIALEVSDFPFFQEGKSTFMYRLREVESNWNLLSGNSNRIAYNNLKSGTYCLEVCRLDLSDKSLKSPYTISFIIHPPWYYTLCAKSVYLILLLSFIVWIVNFFRVKNRLKYERLEKEKIMEQSRMKMDFLANLSHELKTPLSMVIAPISRILPKIKDQTQKQQLKLVQHNAIKINSLTHRMLDFNRMEERSDSMLILSHIELVSFVKKLFTIFREAEDEDRVGFKFVSNRDQIYLDLDEVKWESILTNLLSNAVKYTPDGGEIVLSISFYEDTGELEISVTDTGIGIPEKDIPYIFQRFFQSSKTVDKKEGTGIGLYLVKNYAELHGGKISVTSQEDKGSTFTITLPLYEDVDASKVVATKKEVISNSENDKNKPLILVVDDDMEMASLMRDILQYNYRCLFAKDGKNGIDICYKEMPDLIISDVMMPQMNGLEMCHKIKSHQPTSTIPIIILTGKDDRTTELESIKENIDAFIAKPFEPDILLSRIEQLLRKKQRMEKKIRMEMISAPKESQTVSLDERFLLNITEIIEDHLADYKLNVAALSEISGINNKQIYRKIKQLTGMSPVEYIKSVRMKKAAMLLRQQKFSVAEVMYLVGFSNHSYFSKCFKAEFNMTPWQYKEV